MNRFIDGTTICIFANLHALLYENDVMPLYAMALEQQRYQEAAGLDTLGTALTALQSDIRELQNAYALHQAGKD